MDNLDQDQRALLWSIRHGDIARQNLDAANNEFSDYRARTDRAAWKWSELVHLILHHGYTDIPTLAAAWGISLTRTRSSVRKLIKRGALRDVTMPASDQRLIMLTPMGLADARSTLNTDAVCITNPARIGRTLIGHTLACQRAAIDHDDHGAQIGLHQYDAYLVDTLLQSPPFSARPDVTLAADHEATMIEVELTRKNPRRITEKMEGLATLILDESKRTSACVWYCPPGQVADALARARDRLDGRLVGAAPAISIQYAHWLTEFM